MKDGAYQAIARRLEEFERSGDARCVTDPQALDEVAALRAAIGWPAFHAVPDDAVIRRELDAILLAGRFLLARMLRLPPGAALDEMLEASELFLAAYPFAPGAVPGPLRETCASMTGPDPDASHMIWQHEAIDLLDEAGRTGDLEAVDQAIGLLSAATLAARHELPLPSYLSQLGTAWMDRFRLTGRPADLDHALTAHRRAIALFVPRDEDHAGHLANYCDVRLAQFEQGGDGQALDGALAAGRAAVRLARAVLTSDAPLPLVPGEGADRRVSARRALQASLTNLGAALLDSFDYRRTRDDLDEAIGVIREAAGLHHPDEPARPSDLANLAQALIERFSSFWRPPDLAEALRVARAAVDAAVPRGPVRLVCLVALAFAQRARYTYSGDHRDLDEAIALNREALAGLPAGHPKLLACRSNLACALLQRHQDVADSGALDEAAELLSTVVAEAPPGHVRRPSFLNNLGDALREQFLVSGRAADIERSVAVLTESVATAQDHEVARAGYAANLVLSLTVQSERTGDPGPLARGMALLEGELASAGQGHPLRYTYLSALGNAWRAHYEVTSDSTSLDRAIDYYRQSVEAVPAGHFRRAEYLTGLGDLLRRRFERTGNREAARAAMDVSRRAAAIGTASAAIRASAARNWGDVAAGLGDAQSATEGLATAVGLLDQVAWHRLGRRDQERQLTHFGALACDAAAWAIEAGDPEHAVQLLEQGRGVLLAQALRHRARHHELHREASRLAGQLDAIEAALEPLPAADDLMKADDDIVAARRAELTAEREAVLAQIRRLPGFADFLLPPAFGTVRDAAGPGPVAIINISSHRCDALIVTAAGVRPVSLPRLSGADTVRRARSFLAAMFALHASDLEERLRAAKTITGTLGWLWDTVVTPLLPELTGTGGPAAAGQRPRVWWCPTGPLTFLPLHAAGHHALSDQEGDGHGGGGQAVADRMVSSYAPTLRLLGRARQAAADGTAGREALVVALPETPGQKALPSADQEARELAGRLGQARVLLGSQATRESVGQALRRGPAWAHFACHGRQDVTDPSAGALVLHDGMLTIGEVGGLRLDHAELAFLSACETFVGGPALADEAITLATAFQLAGFRHVVGTLWRISDNLAPQAADHVYGLLTSPGGTGLSTAGTALALDSAMRALRSERPDAPWLWAPYVHIGP